MREETKEIFYTTIVIITFIFIVFAFVYFSRTQFYPGTYEEICKTTRNQAIMSLSSMIGTECRQRYIDYMLTVPCAEISKPVDFKVLCKGINISDNETINKILQGEQSEK